MIGQEERQNLESCIEEAEYSAERYLETGKDVHAKLLELSIDNAMEIFKSLSSELKDDEMLENYKIHLLVPLQMYKLIQKKNGQ